MYHISMALAIVSVMLEMFLITKVPAIRHYFTRHDVQGMMFSFALSLFLGTVFGAAGTVAMIGGIMSTVITTLIYKTGVLRLVDQYELRKTQIHSSIKYVMHVSVMTVVLMWKFVTAPVRFLIWIKHQFVRAHDQVLALLGK